MMIARYGFLGVALAALLGSGCGGDRGDTEVLPTSRPVEQPDHFLEFLSKSTLVDQVYTTEWSGAYYRAVDPDNERTTLSGWKRANDFQLCHPDNPDHELVHVTFRDTKDLGYGRDMYACSHSDGRLSVFVNNYVVKLFAGDPTNYGPLNLEAAIRGDRDHIAGTNAIEFSPIDPDDPDSDKVAKFFTFRPSGERLDTADLDGRGKKPMPQPCMLCHGARLLPLDVDGNVPEWSVRSPKMNQLEVDTFEYTSAYAGYTRAEMEERLRKINSFVRATYAEIDAQDENVAGIWHADFAMDLADTRYGGDISVTDATYDESAVPVGWQQTPERPQGVEVLFRKVIQPHCIACHSLRGTEVGERLDSVPQGRRGNAINFSSYEKFIGYADIVEDYVFRRAVMPLSLRNYEKFWSDVNGAPAILASFLPGFDHYDDHGRPLVPGRPVAMAGIDRTVKNPVALNGEASMFARTFLWTLVDQPGGAAAQLLTPTSPQAVLTDATIDGDYVVRLTVENNRGSDSADVVITVDSGLTRHQDELTFVDDVMPMMLLAPGAGGSIDTGIGLASVREACVNCHANPPTATYRGIPVSYDSEADIYANVLARVDLEDPENSIILRKPTREQHGGGVVIDVDDPEQAAAYNLILNWIREGAVCGSDPDICGG